MRERGAGFNLEFPPAVKYCKPNEKPRFSLSFVGDAAIKFSEWNTMGQVIRLSDWIDLKMNMARHLILLSADYLATSDHHFSLSSFLSFFLPCPSPFLVFLRHFFLLPPFLIFFFYGVSILMAEA